MPPDTLSTEQEAMPSEGNSLRQAMLIGVSTYDNSESWPTLTGADKDITAWAAQLKQFGFEVEQLTTRDETTRTAILSRVRDKCFQMPSQGCLLIIFAGHGVSVARQQWLVPSDAPRVPTGRKAPFLIANYEDYLLPADFRGAISETDAEHTMLVIDACRTQFGPADRREASPFHAAPSRANQRVILVHAAIPGASAFEIVGKGGFLSGAMVGALEQLGQNATLSEIFDETDKRIRKTLSEQRIDDPAAGLRVQCEWGPNFEIRDTRFFAQAANAPVQITEKNKKQPANVTAGFPQFDIKAFHTASGRERRARAYAFLCERYKFALNAAADREDIQSECMPTRCDSRVYEDDIGYLDFNFWSAVSPINRQVASNDCFWYFLSLSTRVFDSNRQPTPSEVQIPFGAVLSEYGLRQLGRDVGRSPVNQVVGDLQRKHPAWYVRENDFGNLEIVFATLTLADLSHVREKKFTEAFSEAIRETEAEILKAISSSKRSARNKRR